ncbi:MAG TPA: hypothetical protein VEC37_10985 [Bacillota bacterium]|nr:hypothetical protein [Bacillota bacterium]
MQRIRLTVVFLGVILLLAIQVPAMAVENSITMGYTGMQIVNWSYERAISDNTTVSVDYGWIFDAFLTDEPIWDCYGLGFKWYFKDHAFDGGYIGVHATHVDAKGDILWDDFIGNLIGADEENDSWECEPFDYFTWSLGYKKATPSGFTYEAALQLIYFDGVAGGAGKATLGYSW